MREILFRAKAINRVKGREYRTSYKNGNWVYGLVTKMYDDRFPNLPATMRNTDGVSNIDVDYKSIGQYTGLTDKNGKKIFENDIVKIKGKTRYIFYGSSGFRHTNYGEYADTLEKVSTTEDCEVIGNIYDNPELLEVKE
nr:MAG TPA: YopX protein [Caudoviricetes sp.]